MHKNSFQQIIVSTLSFPKILSKQLSSNLKINLTSRGEGKVSRNRKGELDNKRNSSSYQPTFLALFSFSSVSQRTQARAAPTVHCSAFLSYSVYVIKYFLWNVYNFEGREGKGEKEKKNRVRTNNGIESRVPIHQLRGTTSCILKKKKRNTPSSSSLMNKFDKDYRSSQQLFPIQIILNNVNMVPGDRMQGCKGKDLYVSISRKA